MVDVFVHVVLEGVIKMSSLVSDQHLLSYVDDEVLSLTREHFKERSDCEAQIIECLKFLYLMSSQTYLIQGFLPVTQDIDDIWHYFIIQTREYELFCKRLPGGFFIHHKSIHFNVYAKTKSREAIVRDFIKWVKPYKNYFSDFSQTMVAYWIAPKYICKTLNITPEELCLKFS